LTLKTSVKSILSPNPVSCNYLYNHAISDKRYAINQKLNAVFVKPNAVNNPV